MSDKQPLLKKSSKLSHDDGDDDDNENTKRRSTDIFSDWRQCFSNKGGDDKYKKLDDDNENKDKNESFSFFRLFSFTDRIDLLLMFIAFCLIMLHTTLILANLVIFGRLTGLFAAKSFQDSYLYEHQNSTIFNMSNYECPLGLELNPFNYNRLHKLCRNTDAILSSTVAPSMALFRAHVMHLIHWLIVLGIVEIISATIECFIWSLSVKRQTSRMSVALFESLIQRNITYLDTNPASRHNSKLVDNITKIEQGIGFEFLILIALVFSIVASVILAFVINWRLTLIMLCLIPVILGGSFVFSKITFDTTVTELNTYSTAGQVAQEVFSSFRTVLSLNGGKFEQKRYERELQPSLWSGVHQGAVFGVFVGWLSLIVYIVYSVGFVFGSFLMSDSNYNAISLSDILVVVSIFAQSVGYFSYIGPFLQSFLEARGAAAPVFRLIDEAQDPSINEPEIWKDSILDKESIDINGDIEFDNVNFVYPARKDVSVLRNLNFIARAGQTTALVGSSGCGKSTCISLLLRLYEPSSGRITISGQSITDYNLKNLRQSIGVVGQEPVLFGVSIYENIRFGKVNATRAEIEEAARQANAHNFIMQLPKKYETLVGEHGIQLSGGEKQRVALARALVKQPTLLLLDEATSALDNASEKIVQEALDRACKNRTTIVIAHRLSTIKNAHQIYVLDNGNVIEQGTHETLVAKKEGKYQALVKTQQMETRDDDKDDIISMAKVAEEAEKQFSERSRLLSNSQAVSMDKERSTSSNRQFASSLRLLSMNSPEWITLLIGCIACLLNGLAEPLFAILLTKIIMAFKYLLYSERRRHVLISTFIFLLLGFTVMVLRFFQYTAFTISGSKLVQRIRSKAFACLLRQEVAYFDQPENSSGAICTRLSSDALAIKQMAGIRLGAICESLALSSFSLMFGLIFSWQLTILVIIPISINTIASALTAEVIYNMGTIKQLSVEKEVLKQYSQFTHQIYKLSRKYFLINSVTYGTFWGLDILVSICLYWRGLVLIEQNEIKSSEILMVFAFAIFAVQTMRTISMISTQIGKSVSAAQSFFDLFDRIPAIDNASNQGQELADFRGKIDFDQVKFTYPTRPTSIILYKFQLSIKPGQRVALVGASGCGKSTIVQLLERFYDTTHGKLFLDDIDIRQLNIQWIRSRFGLVSQEPVLFDLTIAENIAYGLENVPMEDIINAATKANIHSFIQQLPEGYDTKVGMKGSLLSGGEKQRIAIARALLRRPKVLILDEATSAMDSHNEQVVQQALEQAQTEDATRTSLIIAHRLSTIRSCDLICVLDKGHIVESGTHTELIQRRGTYYKMLNRDNFNSDQ